MKHTRLFPYQIDGVRRINRDFDGRCLLADEVGLGKTLSALYYTWKYLPDDPPGPVVVVVPSHLKINWAREAQNHLGIGVEILSGQTVPDDKPPPVGVNKYYVVNYDILVPPRWRVRTKPPENSWAAWLRAASPRLVIADEGHYLSNPASARTRAVRWVCRGVDRVLILTGTPLVNKPINLFPLVNLLRPDVFPSLMDFGAEFTFPSRRRWGMEYRGARNLPELHDRLTRTCLIRRRKRDVLDQLPSLTTTVVPIDVDLREYRRAEADYVAWLAETAPAMAKSAARAAEMAKLGGLKRMAAELKLDAVLRWISDWLDGTDNKVLVGAVHYKITGPLLAACGRAGVLVDGRLTDKEKNDRFDRFNSDPSCRVLVGNILAAGTGWSCRSASDVAVVELPWRPGDVTQFVGRCYGLKRGVPGRGVHVRFLVAAGTVEEDICKLLDTKRGWQESAIDGKPDADAAAIYAAVRAAIKRRT